MGSLDDEFLKFQAELFEAELAANKAAEAEPAAAQQAAVLPPPQQPPPAQQLPPALAPPQRPPPVLPPPPGGPPAQLPPPVLSPLPGGPLMQHPPPGGALPPPAMPPPGHLPPPAMPPPGGALPPPAMPPPGHLPPPLAPPLGVPRAGATVAAAPVFAPPVQPVQEQRFEAAGPAGAALPHAPPHAFGMGGVGGAPPPYGAPAHGMPPLAPPGGAPPFFGVPTAPFATGARPVLPGGVKTGVVRAAAGKKWVDTTLTEWPENDFRIFVGNLGNEVSDNVLAAAFQKYASFQKAKVVRYAHNDKSKGYGFVSLGDPIEGARVMKEMQGKYVGNRPVQLKRSTADERTVTDKKGRARTREVVVKARPAKIRKPEPAGPPGGWARR